MDTPCRTDDWDPENADLSRGANFPILTYAARSKEERQKKIKERYDELAKEGYFDPHDTEIKQDPKTGKPIYPEMSARPS